MEQIERVAERSPKRIARWLVMGNLLIAALLGAATQANLYNHRQADFVQTTQAADNLAHSLSVEVAAQIRLVGNALGTIVSHVHPPRAVPPSDWVQALDADIQQQQRLVPFAAAIRFAETNGVVGSRFTRNSPVTINDRDYFARALLSDDLVISDPLQSRVLNDWCIVLARRLKDRQGHPLGVVYAVLPSSHFSALFAKLNLGAGDAIALRNEQFKLIARYAADTRDSRTGLGSDQVSNELRAQRQKNPQQGVYEAITAIDGVPRVHVYRAVPGTPFFLVAGLGPEQFHSPWAEDDLRQWGLTLAVITLVALGSVYLYRQHRREHRALVCAADLAKQQNLLIENEWVCMLRVRDRRITWVNRALSKMLGYQQAELIGQSTRILYPDEATFELVGQAGYRALKEHGSFHTQTQMQKQSGERLWTDLSGTALDDHESVWMVIDVDALKQSEEQARHLAFHDGLTGLANRRYLHEHMRRALAQSQRDHVPVAVAYLDLDGFKPVNDRLGHDAGDEVLRLVGVRLLKEVRTTDLVARLGGDEFAIVLSGAATSAEVPPVLTRCLNALQEPITLSTGDVVSINASFGVAVTSLESPSLEETLGAADAAMYQAKRMGKGRICLAAPPIPKAA